MASDNEEKSGSISALNYLHISQRWCLACVAHTEHLYLLCCRPSPIQLENESCYLLEFLSGCDIHLRFVAEKRLINVYHNALPSELNWGSVLQSL